MAKKETLTPEELERQADALLAAADGKESAGQRTVMTDEEAKKAGIVRLDD